MSYARHNFLKQKNVRVLKLWVYVHCYIPPLHFRFPALPQVASFALTFVVVSILGARVERKSLYLVDYKLSLGILPKNDPDGSFDNRFTCYQTLENIDLVVWKLQNTTRRWQNLKMFLLWAQLMKLQSIQKTVCSNSENIFSLNYWNSTMCINKEISIINVQKEKQETIYWIRVRGCQHPR